MFARSYKYSVLCCSHLKKKHLNCQFSSFISSLVSGAYPHRMTSYISSNLLWSLWKTKHSLNNSAIVMLCLVARLSVIRVKWITLYIPEGKLCIMLLGLNLLCCCNDAWHTPNCCVTSPLCIFLWPVTCKPSKHQRYALHGFFCVLFCVTWTMCVKHFTLYI